MRHEMLMRPLVLMPNFGQRPAIIWNMFKHRNKSTALYHPERQGQRITDHQIIAMRMPIAFEVGVQTRFAWSKRLPAPNQGRPNGTAGENRRHVRAPATAAQIQHAVPSSRRRMSGQSSAFVQAAFWPQWFVGKPHHLAARAPFEIIKNVLTRFDGHVGAKVFVAQQAINGAPVPRVGMRHNNAGSPTTSGSEPPSVATSGTPHDSASPTGNPNPS